MTFADLGLVEPLVRAVAELGYTAPSPIQAQAIPHILASSDVLGSAQTGTGKTAAFALPILQRLGLHELPKGQRPKRTPRAPRVLVLAPTRELATQIDDSFAGYGRHTGVRTFAIFGGVGQGPQVNALRNGLDVLVATPGRLLDLINQGHCDLSAVEVFVLDEADHMLDMGFIRDIRKICGMVPKVRQTLLFSATMPGDIRSLADAILREPVRVQSGPVSTPAQAVSQAVYHIRRAQKPALLELLLKTEATGRTLVFSRTKHGADRIVKQLGKSGIDARAIHGNKTQNARTRALDSFKAGRTNVLIATDIAARGIDVDDVQHVVNFDLPNTADTYVHRIGRTARAGASGVAITMCDRDEMGDLRAIERRLGRQLDVRPVGELPPVQHVDMSVEDNADDVVRSYDRRQPRRGGGRSSSGGGGYAGGGNSSQGGGYGGGQGGGGRKPHRKGPAKPANQSNAATSYSAQANTTGGNTRPAKPPHGPNSTGQHRNGPRPTRPANAAGQHRSASGPNSRRTTRPHA
jgi:ATP-dependent RNA helicase RhlE